VLTLVAIKLIYLIQYIHFNILLMYFCQQKFARFLSYVMLRMSVAVTYILMRHFIWVRTLRK